MSLPIHPFYTACIHRRNGRAFTVETVENWEKKNSCFGIYLHFRGSKHSSHHSASMWTQKSNVGLDFRNQLVEKQLSTYLLNVIFQGTHLGPSAAPADLWQVLIFKVQMSSAWAPQGAWRGPPYTLLVGDTYVTQDCIPLSAKHRHRCVEEFRCHRQTPKDFSSQPDHWIIQNLHMLSASKPSCLGVFDVDVHCSSLLQSVLWKNQIRAHQIDKLIGMEHAREAQCH